MIFNFKNFFVSILLIFTICINSFSQIAEQGLPFIHNITPNESGFKGENFSIIQDERAVMYFGNFSGLLEYDGSSWNNFPVNGNPILAKNNMGNIIVGAFNQIYSFQYDRLGKLNLVPILDSVGFGQIQNIIYEGSTIIFTTKNNLFIYHESLQKIFDESSFVKMFRLKNRILINSPDLGIIEFDLKRFKNLPESKFFINKEIKGIIPIDSGYIAVTFDKCYTVRNGKVKPFESNLSSLLIKDNFKCQTTLSNQNIAVGTRNNGIVILNSKGSITSILNKNNGLYDNQVNALLVDNANTLWVAYGNGMARVETPSAYSYFDFISGIKGKVKTIIRFNDSLFIGTDAGIFYQKQHVSVSGESPHAEISFFRYKNFTSSCQKLMLVNGHLLASTSSGLYSINKTTQLILSDQINTIQKSIYWNNTLYVATSSSLLGYQFEKGKWHFVGGLKGFRSKITSIAESKEGLMWIGTQNEGVFMVNFSDLTFNDAQISPFRSGHGLPSGSSWIDAYNTSKGVVFSTNKGPYRFNFIKKSFVKDSLIDINKSDKDIRINPIMEDGDKNLWMSYETPGNSQKPVLVAWNLPNIKKYTCISQPFNRIKDFICETIYPDKNLVVWFGGFNGLVCLDFKKLKENNSIVNTLIRRVVLNSGDSVLFYNTAFNTGFQKSYLPISFKNRTIRFEFATPVYEKNNEILHQTKLDGFDDEWSDFSIMYSKEYTNLPPGEYTFRVRAKNLFENISHEAIFKFRIKKPFYSTYYAITLYILLLISFIMILLQWRSFQFSRKEIRLRKIIDEKTEEYLNEKEKTESILANILPEKTVKELKDKDKASTVRFKMATVLFSDIQGFTKIAEIMSPDVLVDELDKLFIQFDKIIEKYNIEKIKTIGDAYMCAGGIPKKNRTNPIDVVLAALEMQGFVREQQEKAEREGSSYWGLRIGVHTGPVVAGVIGKKKFTYDIWGDTVNIANRMETAGEGNMVNISEDTYLLINEFFDCVHRGKMPIKYKGEVDMYFVKGLKEEFCKDELGLIPNKEMLTKLDLLQFEDLEEFMFDKLEAELPKHLYYHSVKHTIDVVVHVEILAIEEKVSSEELLLLKTAALFHDSGFIVGNENHEERSVIVAEELLPQFGYSKEQRMIINELILATRMPHNPKNKLEQIICDADLDYLGRPDYLHVSNNLYRELLEQNIIKNSEYEWNKIQLKFLREHRFFTESAKRRRNQNKTKQLNKIIEQDYKYEKERLNAENL